MRAYFRMVDNFGPRCMGKNSNVQALDAPLLRLILELGFPRHGTHNEGVKKSQFLTINCGWTLQKPLSILA